MFAIYRKNVGGRIHNRYFKDYKNARSAIAADVQDLCEGGRGVVTETIDRMNHAKGFWDYEVRLTVDTGTICEQASLAIIDGYFEDE